VIKRICMGGLLKDLVELILTNSSGKVYDEVNI